jgi:hypothetical protein
LSVVAAVFFVVTHLSTDRTTMTDADVDHSRVFKNNGVTLPLRFATGGDDAVAVVVSFIGGAMTTMGGGGGTDDDSSPLPESASTTTAIWPSARVASSSSARFPFVARRSKGGRRCARRRPMIATDAQSSVEFSSHRIEDKAAAAPTPPIASAPVSAPFRIAIPIFVPVVC